MMVLVFRRIRGRVPHIDLQILNSRRVDRVGLARTERPTHLREPPCQATPLDKAHSIHHHSIMRHVQNDHSRDDWWSLPWMFQLARVWKRGPGRSRALPAWLAAAARPHTWVEVTEAPTERGARPAGRSCRCSTQAARRIGSKSASAREIALGALGS